MFNYAGAIHIHSSYSFDGNTNVEEIIAAARRQKLDFIIITDHYRLDAQRDGWEGWHDGVLVLAGEEISPRYNHYLAFGIDTPVIAWKKETPPQEYIDAVNRQGGFGFIAHPDHTGAPKFAVKDYPWNDWSVKGYAGISIWDLMTDWQEKLTSPLAAVFAYLFPAWVLSGPKKETLARWDEATVQRRVAGYGEVDNHNTPRRFAGLTLRIFPFDYAFSTLRTRVVMDAQLSASPATAKKQVFAALKDCRLFVAQERWHTAEDFLFRVYNDTATATAGSEFFLGTRPSLVEVRIPHPGRLRLLRNGKVLKEEEKQYLQMGLEEPGVYRVEAEQKVLGRYKPWIYSNPIWVNA